MKLLVTFSRIFTGLLFVFSGLVKAIDPRGLAYKMQEFFEAWAHDGFFPQWMDFCNEHALLLSVGMITLEVLVGAALLLGWRSKWTTAVLLSLILFFTFLTGYVLFTGNIRACGCFGDCIPLTPIQTFSKDLILLMMCILLVIKRHHIQPISSSLIGIVSLCGVGVLTLLLQYHALTYLPLIDCLPYQKGNNLLELRKMPANAVPDKYDYVFVYSKEGIKKEFTVSSLPDSSWAFEERKQVLVQKGSNNSPLINDFSFTAMSGTDTTESILGQQSAYYILFIKDVETHAGDWNEDKALIERLLNQNLTVYVVTAQRKQVTHQLSILLPQEKMPLVFTCDATAIKSAARANPVLFQMKGPVVQEKISWAQFQSIH
jgi:hypothetical protein